MSAQFIALTRINPNNPLTSLDIVHEDNIPLFEIGAIFNPHWLARIKDFRVLRFMPWMRTNNSKIKTWDDMPKTSDYSYTNGVPLSVLIRLANLTGTDPWFTLPHMADDELVKQFGETVKRDLYPHRKAYVEYSNEIWNFQFEQTRWAQEQANQLWKNRAGGDAWIQFAGLRAAQIAGSLKEIFANDADSRLVNVLGVHTAWMDLADIQLEGPLIKREWKSEPSDIFDAYAVTGYLRPDFEGTNTGETIAEWLSQGGENHVFAMLDRVTRETRLEFLREEAWPNHFERAQKHGLDLIMYEGGTHVILPYSEQIDPIHIELVTKFNYSPYMDALYQDAFDAWNNVGGELYNVYVDIAPASRWGSWGHLRHLDDDTSRWAKILSWNKQQADYEPVRDATDFSHGIITNQHGSPIQGTEIDDVLIGTDGDDIFVSSSGYDLLNGSTGFDQLIVEGNVSDYRFDYDGTRHLIEKPGMKTWFVNIDYVVFPDEGLAIVPSDLR